MCFAITLRILEMADVDFANKVRFHYLSKARWLKHRMSLKMFMASIFREEKKQLQVLDVIFCSDEYLLKINQQYLKHDTYTDVITFDLTAGGSKRISGEIYVSLDRVAENAVHYDVAPSDELYRVLFHGILHLCGYSDKSASEKKKIRNMENVYLAKYMRVVSRETRST